MPVSTVPAAISALLALAQAAIPDADVFAGPPTAADYADWLGIAYLPNGGEVVTADRTWSQIGQQKFEESFDIACTIGSESGDLDHNARTVRSYELLDEFAAALAADYDLGGLVRVAHVSGHALVTEVDDNGLSASLRFTVNVATRIG